MDLALRGEVICSHSACDGNNCLGEFCPDQSTPKMRPWTSIMTWIPAFLVDLVLTLALHMNMCERMLGYSDFMLLVEK